MERYDVAIATTNPKVMYLVVELVKNLNLSFVHCNIFDYRCRISRVVVTTQEEAENCEDNRTVIVDSELSLDSTSIDIMVKLFGLSDSAEFSLGVDPGMQFGLALLMNGSKIYTQTNQTPRESARRTLLWAHHILCKFNQEAIIRVGTGSRLYSTLYLRAIKEEGSNLPIELVDERHTTFVGGSDQASAILIAQRKGRSITDTDLLLEPKAGYIRSLKRYAARLTNDTRKLSTAEAKSVLTGDISLDDILSKSS